MNKKISLILHDIRSAHNVGSIFRSADGLGVEKLYLSGYTPYPQQQNDERLPHIRKKIDSAIHKTALGAESYMTWKHFASIEEALQDARSVGMQIFALEQAKHSTSLHSIKLTSNTPVALLVGNEVTGLPDEIVAMCDKVVEIPMLGKKESHNVSVAAAIAAHWLLFSE